ncbi:MAG TPA: S49 family peptidase, partial [Opitutales bacterium]|nr:S49 family peptidase [Opitutales bacterium]
MGNYAASGAYWISAPARHIVADPTTLTGSIGVFGVTFDVQRLCSDYGVSWDGVKTSPFADANTLSRPKTVAEMAQLQAQTEYTYHLFIEKVASGRHLDKEKVQTIAQGHIWSGEEALKLGLVDELGGLDVAIQKAVAAAEIKGPWYLHQITSERSFLETLRSLTPGRMMRVLSGDLSLLNEKVMTQRSQSHSHIYALWTGWWGVPSFVQKA